MLVTVDREKGREASPVEPEREECLRTLGVTAVVANHHQILLVLVGPLVVEPDPEIELFPVNPTFLHANLIYQNSHKLFSFLDLSP